MTEEKRDNNEEAPSAFSSPVPTSSPVHLVDQRVSSTLGGI